VKALIRSFLNWRLQSRCRRFAWNALEKSGQEKKAEKGTRLLLEMATRNVPLTGVGHVSTGWFSSRAVHLPVWLLQKIHCFDPRVGRHVVRQLIRENHVQSQVVSLETMWHLLYEKPDVETVALFLGEDRFWEPGGTPVSYRRPDTLPGYLKSANPADLPAFLQALGGRFVGFSLEGLKGLVEAMVEMTQKVEALPMEDIVPLSESIGEWVRIHVNAPSFFDSTILDFFLVGASPGNGLPFPGSRKCRTFFTGLAVALDRWIHTRAQSVDFGGVSRGFEIKPGMVRVHPWLAFLGTGTHPYADLFALHPFWSSCNQALIESEALNAVLPASPNPPTRHRL
jgi:hypothetical protein